MRNLVLLLLGVAIGAIATVNVINALRQRDAYPRGLMNVMQHHYATLREAVRRNRCGNASGVDLTVLRQSAQEIGSAVYSGDIPDAPFREFEQRLQDALAAMPATCTDASAALDKIAFDKNAFDKISAACDACHRQYR